jgi:hypothetical protein
MTINAWRSTAINPPSKSGQYLVYVDDGIEVLGYFKGAVTNDSDTKFYGLEGEADFFYDTDSTTGDALIVDNVKNWQPLPQKPGQVPEEYNIDIVNSTEYTGRFIRNWVQAHMNTETEYTENAFKIYDAIWGATAKAKNMFPINMAYNYRIVSFNKGEGVVARRVQ